MKAVVIVLSIIAFAACLLIGMQAGSGSLKLPDPTHLSDTPSALPASTQRTLLIILADDLQSSKPRLAGLWTVMYRPDTPRFMLVPLYPANNAEELASAFSLTNDLAPQPAFLKAVQDFHFTWSGTILIDENGAKQLISALGSEAPLPALVMPWDRWDEALPSQTSFGKAVCELLADQNSRLELKPMLEGLSSADFRSEISFNQLSQDWRALTRDHADVSCEFITP